MSSTQEVGQIFGEGRGPAQAMLRSPTVLIVSIGLWGMNIFFFRLFGINYSYVLNYDLMKEKEEQQYKNGQIVTLSNERDLTDDEDEDLLSHDTQSEERSGASITWTRLVFFSLSLLVMLHATTNVWIDWMGRSSIGAVFSFYIVVLVYILLPVSANRWLRRSSVIVLQRTYALIHPRCSCFSSDPAGPRPVPFVDVFYADAMCSLSKVFFDWGMLFHMAAHYPEAVPPAAHNILIPSACAAVPYIIRARQCLIMYTVGRIKSDPKRYQHLANALKYCTSIFPICLSAYLKTVDTAVAAGLEHYLTILLVVNASYALYWDIVMDWGMMQNPTAVVQVACTGGAIVEGPAPQCHHAVLRPRLRFGILLSLLILLTDTVLRFSWMLKFVAHNTDNFVLVTQFLEVFRRAIWNLLRVEWEHIKQQKKKLEDGESVEDSSSTEPLKDSDSSPNYSARIQLGPKIATA